MKKIIALLCGLLLFTSISVACGSNKTGESSSSNISSSITASEADSSNEEADSSSPEPDSSNEEVESSSPEADSSDVELPEDSSNIESEDSSSEMEESSKDDETEQYYTVTFDSDGGTVVAEQRIRKGEKVIKTENPTKASTETVDFEFVGWYVEETAWDFDKNTVEKDIILHAKWSEKKYSADLPI